uniref:Uncharacterized protein n=1 Tax=viral metagenome TaxID=1070528 RepID=A0A6C0C1D1_9ZZZZ
MPRIKKGKDGRYHVHGKSYKYLVGKRQQVANGTAYKTTYGKDALLKKDILKNKWGRYVSAKKSRWGKKRGLKQLRLAGYTTKKGKFGAVKMGSPKRKTRKRSRSKGTRKKRICRHKSGPKKGKYKKC